MANEQHITIRGRLTNDPELRFTPNGAAVANFTIAQNARIFDKQTNEWKDKEATFWRCSAWREMAENVAESLTKGMAVVAFAELESRSFEDKEGNKRTVTEARIESIGPDLRWASAKVNRTPSGGASQGAQNVASQLGGQPQQGWGAPSQQPAWGNGADSEAPF